MEANISTLASVWYVILLMVTATALALEGTSLGVGMMTLFMDRGQREDAMGSISPVWHANMTWLVVTGGILFAAFPLYYGMILSTLYIPAILMLLGLMARSVALELYAGAENKRRWGLAFGLGSLAAALGLALGLGGAVAGAHINFAGGDLRWITPLSLAVAGTVIVLALLLACVFLVAKTEGSTRAKARFWSLRLFPALMVYGALTDIWVFSTHPLILYRWLTWPAMLTPLAVFALALAAYVLAWARLVRDDERALVPLSLAFVYLLALGYGVCFFPWLIPGTLTAGQAAGQELTLKALSWIVGPLLPLLAVYNIYLHGIFKGKVGKDGYSLYDH